MTTPALPARSSLALALTLAAGFAASPPALAQGGADPSDDAFQLGSPPELPDGLTEENMWPAASAEGWAEPCLVHWQRTFDDAVSVARAQNRPLLVAVNMDGEIASEHFAGVKYRDPVTAELMSRYACVIASVYRHTPRDYDEAGARVECPRFGTVTCGEHIQAERELYDVYFDGRRVAPRHIVLDLEGTETYDVYYAWNTDTVLTTFVKGVEGWPEPLELAEPTLVDRVRSRSVVDREIIEQSYAEGNRETKRAILLALLEDEAADQVEVLRSAIFGFDLEFAKLSRRALAKCETEGALDLMAEALKVPLEESERELLLAAVNRMGESSPRARTLGALHSGLSVGSRHIDPGAAEAFAREYEANAAVSRNVQALAEAAEARPDEPEALLELAEALLARAQEAGPQRYTSLLLQDARTAASEAESLGARGPRLDAVVAVVSAELGDTHTARLRAVAAMEGGLMQRTDAAPTETALTDLSRDRVLRLFADARRREIRGAYRAGVEWAPEWLSDVNAAYTLLAESSLADADTFVEHYDFLRWIGGTPRANAVLEQALARFPDAPVLHERLRGRLLWEGGPEELERAYEERLARRDDPSLDASQLTWFAGYASLVAAEHYRRRNRFDEALEAYERATKHYEENIALFPEARDNGDHYIALGHAGRARIALERGDLASATDLLIASFELRPDSAATQDGLGITPIASAKMLKARWLDANDEVAAARVQTALDALDPALLEPPPSEQRASRWRQMQRGTRDQ